MSTAKERLAARVAAMTESEAQAALDALAVWDAPLSAEEDAVLRARLDSAEGGEFVAHEDVMERFRARFGMAKASGQ